MEVRGTTIDTQETRSTQAAQARGDNPADFVQAATSEQALAQFGKGKDPSYIDIGEEWCSNCMKHRGINSDGEVIDKDKNAKFKKDMQDRAGSGGKALDYFSGGKKDDHLDLMRGLSQKGYKFKFDGYKKGATPAYLKLTGDKTYTISNKPID